MIFESEPLHLPRSSIVVFLIGSVIGTRLLFIKLVFNWLLLSTWAILISSSSFDAALLWSIGRENRISACCDQFICAHPRVSPQGQRIRSEEGTSSYGTHSSGNSNCPNFAVCLHRRILSNWLWSRSAFCSVRARRLTGSKSDRLWSRTTSLLAFLDLILRLVYYNSNSILFAFRTFLRQSWPLPRSTSRIRTLTMRRWFLFFKQV